MTERVRWDDLTPLNQNNSGYDPDMKQIIEYAEYIGLELPEDNKYLYIAKEGLKAPLPPFWQACESAEGELYFRNRKTREITLSNPLDEIYIQKVRQIRQLHSQNNIYSIVEESALNESSGLGKSKTKRTDLRKSDHKNANQAQAYRILQRHITEESIYSENQSAEKASPHRSDLIQEPPWKIQQRMQLIQLRARIERFVPKKSELITHYSAVEQKREVANIIKMDNLTQLSQLKLKVEEKKAKLEQRQRERKLLQQTLQQVRTQSKQH